jgi:SAM-dependent methyltransferase
MTKPLKATIKIIASCIKTNGKILEVGSRCEAGQKKLANLRGLFNESEFIGVDMRPGPGVDQVMKGENLKFKDKSFDLVLCLELLEHANKPWLVTKELQRVIKNTGIIIASSQQNFPIHAHPSDYFRYTPFGISSLFESLKSKCVLSISPAFDKEAHLNPKHVILIGSKDKNDKTITQIKKAIIKNKNLINVHKPYRHRLRDSLKIIRRGLQEANYHEEVVFW